MLKWYLKNKDGIWRNTIAGIMALIIYNGIIWLQTKLLSFPTDKYVNKLAQIVQIKLTISISVLTLIISITISIATVYYAQKIYGNYLGRKNKLKILKATYYTAEKSLDITQELNNHIKKDKLRILLTNEIAGDPQFGVRKKARLIYMFNEDTHEREYDEDDLIELPEAKSDII